MPLINLILLQLPSVILHCWLGVKRLCLSSMQRFLLGPLANYQLAQMNLKDGHVCEITAALSTVM